MDLLRNATATGAGDAIRALRSKKTFQAAGATTSGAGAATITAEGSNNATKLGWVTLGTITLTLATTSSTDALVVDSPYLFVRGNLTAISGTGASITMTMGETNA